MDSVPLVSGFQLPDSVILHAGFQLLVGADS